MAQLNFPDPTVTQTYTEAGITWTWNATMGVWSTESGGDAYLSKTQDDIARGDITFEGVTTHDAEVILRGFASGLTISEDGTNAGEGIFINNDFIGVHSSNNNPGGFIRLSNDFTGDTGGQTSIELGCNGEASFSGVTTHRNGIITETIAPNDPVVGGSAAFHNGTIPTGITLNVSDVTRNPSSEGARALLVNSTVNDTLDTPFSVIQGNLNGVPSTTNDVNLFQASFAQAQNTSGDVSVLYTGVQKQQNTGSGSVYMLNSQGDAVSFHNGTIKIGNTDLKGFGGMLGQNNTVTGIQLFGGDGAGPSKIGSATFNSGQQTTLSISNNGSGINNRLVNFWLGGSSGVCGKFYALSGSTMALDVGNGGSLINTSDYRAKSNINELGSSVDIVKALRPITFNYNEDLSKVHSGFVAHELQELVPNAVVGEKDAVDEEGNPEYQGADVTKLIPILTKALQEALTRIEQLEAQIGGN